MTIGSRSVTANTATARGSGFQRWVMFKKSARFFTRDVATLLWLTGACVFCAACWSADASAEEQQVSYAFSNRELLGDGPSYLDVGVGVFDFNQPRNGERSAAGRIEFRYGEKLFFFGPAIGIMANSDGGIFGYGGIYADFRYYDFVATPLLALGAYSEGGSTDLSGVFQFRVGLTLSYQINEVARIGVRVAHISNADIHEDNPGEEELFLTYAFSF